MSRRKKYKILLKLLNILAYFEYIVAFGLVLIFILYLIKIPFMNSGNAILLALFFILMLKSIQVFERKLMSKLINT